MFDMKYWTPPDRLKPSQQHSLNRKGKYLTGSLSNRSTTSNGRVVNFHLRDSRFAFDLAPPGKDQRWSNAHVRQHTNNAIHLNKVLLFTHIRFSFIWGEDKIFKSQVLARTTSISIINSKMYRIGKWSRQLTRVNLQGSLAPINLNHDKGKAFPFLHKHILTGEWVC